VDNSCLPYQVEPVQIWHRRIERKERVERECRGWTVDFDWIFAAQARPVWIAAGRNCGETVERTAKDDDKKPRIPAFGQSCSW